MSHKVKHIKTKVNSFGETEYTIEVDGRELVFCIPVGIRCSLEKLIKRLQEDGQ